MIPLLGARTLTRLRYGSPTIAAGTPTRPAPVSSSIIATAQPASQRTLDHMPDGVASRGVIELTGYIDLRTAADGVYPDRVRVPSGLDVEAGDYEVHHIDRSPAFLGQPTSLDVVAVRVQP